ncbi:NAC domain-containing protein 68 [Camellia lanceoleosa]|uniref:NAC domain-containing protein 68 n=1 Tax=Camellia lanceoleosa TaxID=1840588 RepID=A0ACC0FFB3_9ERIC|nr:NAC domain-containing protein 68 [Camellia lanceoleosa]
MSNIFNTVKTNIYVFTQLKKKSGKGKRIDRTVGKMGTWKAIDAPKPVEDHHGRVIGGKRSLDYENKERSGEHGAWNMKEYSLDELIEYYLLNKVTNQPLPMQHVIECDVYDEKQMSNIFNTVKTNLYVFTHLKKKSRKGKRIDRTVGKMGSWKAIDAAKPI